MNELPGEVPPEAVREALHRLLTSGDFKASERNRRFLEHVVDETLSGRPDRIKAYSIATTVFDRDGSFDAQSDPIVRIEAGRLRQALEHYYLTGGAAEPIRITIPKGAYVPRFEQVAAGPEPSDGDPDGAGGDRSSSFDGERSGPEQRPTSRHVRVALLVGIALLAGAAMATWLAPLRSGPEPSAEIAAFQHGPAVFVTTFASKGDATSFPGFAEGFTRNLIVELTRFGDLMVFGPDTSPYHDGEVDYRQVAAELGIDLVLTGVAQIEGDQVEIEALLIDARTGQYLWAERFHGTVGAMRTMVAQNEIAERMARALTQTESVIFTSHPPDTLDGIPEALTFRE